jgi:hypothetical protein
VRDHKIDLVHAQQHGQERIKENKIRAEIMDMPEYDVYDEPYDGGQSQQGIKKNLPLTKESPGVELPGQKGPFQQSIYVDNDGIVLCQSDGDKADDLDEEADDQKPKKGPVAFVYTTPAYQPGNDG